MQMKTYRNNRLIIGLAFLLGLLMLPGSFRNLFQRTARAATSFTVNSVADGADSNVADGVCNDGAGNCTLRAAIEQANALTGTDTINFNIGSGVKTIVLTADLPIISDPVVIDGTTQPGFTGTPIIEINGNGNNRSNTFRAGFLISAGSSTIRGLVINRVNNAAITITTNGGNHIEGNFLGTDITGNVRQSNTSGVVVASSLNTIGGTTAAARNVISGNSGAGIAFGSAAPNDNVIQGNYVGLNASGTGALSNSEEGIRLVGARNTVGGTVPGAGNVISGNSLSGIMLGGQMTTVQGNFIGTNAAGTSALGNFDRGIRISNSPNNIIGGTSAAARNVISGNRGAGISIEESGATGNVVQGNLIGTDGFGVAPLPNSPVGLANSNSSGGIFVNRGINNLIGGPAAGAANTIAFNGATGVRVISLPNTTVGITNRISRNSIYGNLGLGIDLGTVGVAVNDAGDSDTDANNLQNFPIIASVNTVGGSTTVSGTLGSAPNTNYELEFFANRGCHVSGNGEGARFLTNSTVTTDANGNASFALTLPSPLAPGQLITATATDPAGNTSEFSACNSTRATGLAQFAESNLNVREDLSQFPIAVNRVGGNSGLLTVNFATANNTAIAGQDYTSVSGTLTFADGETSKTIFVPIINDGTADSGKTFFLTLSNPNTPEVVGGSGIVVIRIFDVTEGGGLEPNNVSTIEGNTGTTTSVITVRLSVAIGQTVTVNYQTAAMTATSGVDFQPVSGSLTFAPGVVAQTVSVPIVGDVIDEPDETFRLMLTNAVNAFIIVGSNPTRTTIVDDDPTPAISVNDVGVIEGTSGTTPAVFTLNLSSRSAQPVSVNFATADGTANASADYQSATGTVTFNPGETSKTVTVLVNADAVVEPLETFLLNLSAPVNATVADAQGVGTIGAANSAGVGFSAATYNALETDHAAQITVTRAGDSTAAISVDYGTTDGTASERSDYTASLGSIRFVAGEMSKTFTVLLNEDAFQEGDETINLRLSNPTGGTFIVGPSSAVLVIGDTTTSPVNPVDAAQFFVRQQYHDFLNREPDAAGLAFWTNEITSCGSDQACIDNKRINVSAAFFLSIEFQTTGYLVEREYKAAYGDANGLSLFNGSHQLPVPVVRFNEFLPDTQQIGQGVVVGQSGWETALENNKKAFTAGFVQRARFVSAFPISLTPAQFVDQLNANAGNVLSVSERTTAIGLFGSATDTSNVTARAQALRQIAEDPDLYSAEFNRAFVLMQYFGYLRRNPNDPQDNDYSGYDFWLTKLNQANGNFVNSDMVKSFIVSGEYRSRFGP